MRGRRSALGPPAERLCRNKSRFNRLADGIGSALGKHAEWRKPSLSKADPNAPAPIEVRARESLLTPSQKNRDRSASQASQASFISNKTSGSSSTVNTESRGLADVEARYREESEMVRAAQEAVMHRPNFAIDAIGDSDDEGETPDDDAGVMDEVEAFLKEHGGDDDGALKGAEKKVAKGECQDGGVRGHGPRVCATAACATHVSLLTPVTDLLKAEPMGAGGAGSSAKRTTGDLVDL